MVCPACLSVHLPAPLCMFYLPVYLSGSVSISLHVAKELNRRDRDWSLVRQ